MPQSSPTVLLTRSVLLDPKSHHAPASNRCIVVVDRRQVVSQKLCDRILRDLVFPARNVILDDAEYEATAMDAHAVVIHGHRFHHSTVMTALDTHAQVSHSRRYCCPRRPCQCGKHPLQRHLNHHAYSGARFDTYSEYAGRLTQLNPQNPNLNCLLFKQISQPFTV